MNTDEVFDDIKRQLRRVAENALVELDNNFEALSDNMETALDIVLITMRDEIYK